MRVIKTLADLELLRAAEALPRDYLDLLEGHFRELMETFGDGEPEKAFSLEDTGWLLVLERGDNPRALGEFGLVPGGLPKSSLEFVDRYELSLSVYRSFVLMNNEFGLLIYSESGIFDQETERILSEYALPPKAATSTPLFPPSCNNKQKLL